MLCLPQIASWRYLTAEPPAEPAGGGGEAAERVVVEVELDVGGAGWCYAPGDRHTRARARTHARTHKHTNAQAHTRARARTHARTNAQSHKLRGSVPSGRFLHSEGL